MKNVSSEFRKKLNNGNRNYIKSAKITLKDSTELNLTDKNFWNNGVKIEDSTSNDNSFDIGSVIIGQLTLNINNMYDDYSEYDFTDAKINNVKVGLKLDDETVESLQYGHYTVNETKYNGSIITLTAYDNMYKFDQPYTKSTLSYPATLLQIVQDSCSKCDVQLGSYDFPHNDFIIQNKPEDESITFRNVLQWVAQISCCYCKIDPQGRLTFGWYSTDILENALLLNGGNFQNWESSKDNVSGGNFAPWTAGETLTGGDFSATDSYHTIHSFNSLTLATDDVVLTGVRVSEEVELEEGTETKTYQSGSDGYVISIEGNKLIQGTGATVVGFLAEKLIGLRFRSFSASALSDPTIEAGDIAILTDRKGNTYKTIITSNTFQPGNFQSISCGAETPARNSATRYSQATQIYVDYRKEIQKERTEREKALEELGERLEASTGVFTTIEEQPDGSKIYYLHNKPSLDDSDIVWKMTAEAWGVSTDGGKTWNAGMTVDGDTIVRILTATGVNADWINAGSFVVKTPEGKITFSADTATGAVNIVADSFSLSGKTIDQIANEQLNNFVSSVYDPKIAELQKQIDGQIETYYYDYEPTLSNIPASEWTTESEKQAHEGDLFYWKSKGYGYRFYKDGSTWKWQMVQDTDVTKALQQAAQAQDTADNKRRVFISTPLPPYDAGDLWMQGADGDILTCVKSRQSGAFVSSDWAKKNKYTDNSFAEQVQEDLNNMKFGGRNFLLETAEAKTTTYAGTDNDAGSSMISYLFSDYALERLNEDKTVTISFDWEATGTLDGRFHVQTAYNHYTMLTPGYIYISDNNSSGHYTATVTINTAIDFDRIRVIGYQSHATLSIKNLKIESGNKATDWTPAPEDTATYVDNLVGDLQEQVDRKIQTYNQSSDPSVAWTTAALKTQHTGDLWYNTTEKVTARWDGTAWDILQDKEAIQAGELAQSKAQVFIGTPTIPYYKGDLWITALDKTGVVKTCKTTRTSGSYTASDWAEGLKYTDDTAVELLDQTLNSTQEIFNRLTQNGTVKGIYLRDNQLYVNATYIESGAIVIRDENNKIIFKADLDNRQIQIDGDFITIGGSALTDMVEEANSTANDALEQVQNARSFVVYLTNEYQGISTDSDGNYTAFPETKTTAQAFLGSLDVSASCQYSVTKSSGVTGSWSSTTRTYTVTGLSTDSGWVEIKATYLNSLSATKRFTLSKIKQGDPGEFALNLIEGTSEEWTATEITDGANKATPMRSAKNVINDGFAVGKKIQYSVDLKFSQDFAATGTGTKNSYIQFYKNYGTTEWLSMDSNAKSQIEAIIASSSKEGRVNGYITITSDMVPTKASDSIGLRIRFDYYEGTVYTRKEMVALGEKSYSWTPAKEDLKGEPGTDGSDGADGADGRTYFIQPSRTTLRQTASYNISPGYIDFNSYYRDGTDATRKAYAGRFKIEEQSSSGTWTTIYTSAANESSVRHILYNVLADADGNFIGDADGYAFGGWRDISVIRVSLYAAGGTTQLIDQQTIPVVKDGEKGEDGTALTSEEVFNILTDNGAKQGLYMVDDKIYFNAEYIKSGTMVADLIKGGILNLGGVSNENGVLVMKNASGQEIGRWDKDGLVVKSGAISANAISGGSLDLGGASNGNGILRIFNASGTQVGYINNTGVHFSQGEVSANVIKGGTLTLGGASNGNGLLQIRDASGNDIGHISNTGVYFNKGQISANILKGGTLKLGGASNGNGLLQIYNASGESVGHISNTGVHFNEGTFGGSLSAATGTFKGELQAATGTFKGNLSAAGGTFKGDLQAAGGTFSGSLQAARGTFSGSITVGGDSSGIINIKNSNNVTIGTISESGVILNGSSGNPYFIVNSSSGNTKVSISGSGVRCYNGTSSYIVMEGGTIPYLSILDSNGNSTSVRGASISTDGSLSIGSMSSFGGYATFEQSVIANSSITCKGTLTVSGYKNRLVETDNYDERLLYSYEMPSPMFGDIGEATTDENGECYLFLDDIFQETVTTSIEYQVFLQKEGQGDIWIEEKAERYFVVKGTPNLKFAWEIKAKQKDYEYERLESFGTEPEVHEPDYEEEALQDYIKITESYESSTFDAINYYAELEGVA